MVSRGRLFKKVVSSCPRCGFNRETDNPKRPCRDCMGNAFTRMFATPKPTGWTREQMQMIFDEVDASNARGHEKLKWPEGLPWQRQQSQEK